MLKDVAPLSGYTESIGLLAAVLQDGTEEWHTELWCDDIPAEGMTWRAVPGGPSMGAIMLHIIAVEILWIEPFLLGLEMNPEEREALLVEATDVDEGVWPDPPSQPMSWYLAWHQQVRARILSGLQNLTDADIPRQGRERQFTPRWVLGHVIQHEAYHGGQIVLLHEMWKRTVAG